jgi:hypothetical protein
VLTELYASPSRIRGVYRYLLLEAKERGIERSRLERLMMPSSLQDPDADVSREMVSRVIHEGIQMGLFLQEENHILLHPELPEKARDPKSGDRILPLTLAHCFFDESNTQNHDLALAIAWYLCNDAYSAPKNWDHITGESLTQARFWGLNDIRFGQLRDWAVYLGFAWSYGHSLDGRTTTRILTPDPTHFLQLILSETITLQKGEVYPFGDILRRLLQYAPVLEGGFFRNQVEQRDVDRAENHLSSTSSLGWFRLADEGVIDLQYQSDATEVFILLDGKQEKQYSHIMWKN